MVLGRYPLNVADSPVFDAPYNALPGVDQGAFIRCSIPVRDATTDLAATASGAGIAVPIFLRNGDVVINLTFLSGGTAAATLTHWWHALYTPGKVLLAQSADQVDAAWAANTAKKLALSAPVMITEDGWYWAATSTTASTVQTLAGAAPLVGTATLHTGSVAAGVTFGSAMGATAPAAMGTLTAVAKSPIVVVS